MQSASALNDLVRSSAGVALSGMYRRRRRWKWVSEGWHVAVAYVIGFFVMLALIGFHPDSTPRTISANTRERGRRALMREEQQMAEIRVVRKHRLDGCPARKIAQRTADDLASEYDWKVNEGRHAAFFAQRRRRVDGSQRERDPPGM